MKLIILLKTFQGGTGTFVKSLVSELKAIGEIEILSLEYCRITVLGKKVSCFLDKEETYPHQYHLNLQTTTRLIRETFWFMRTVSRYRDNCVVLSVDSHCAIIGTIAAFFLGKSRIRHIATIHNNIEAVVRWRIGRWLRRPIRAVLSYVFSSADVVVCVSRGLSDSVKKYLSLKKMPITIYYDLPKQFGKHIDTVGLSKTIANHLDRPVIVAMGRFEAQKDNKMILDSFEIINKAMPNSRLVMIGAGSEAQELKTHIKTRAIKNVRWVGWRKDPHRILNNSHLFLFASKWEGFGYVLIEAMSCGLPVVATDTMYGPSEILMKGAYGVLVPPGATRAMAEGAITILKSSKRHKQYVKKSLNRAKNFMSGDMARQYMHIILSKQPKQ